ncbi:MAG: DUF4410 domain-containing protein [Alphaproteobacteria bacterium]|nr:DUF4410 domain-containing protein [Alphaproteobacteria bacterium]
MRIAGWNLRSRLLTALLNRRAVVVFSCFLILTGCTHAHVADVESGYTFKPDALIEVGNVINSSEEPLDADSEKKMTSALNVALWDTSLLLTDEASSARLVLKCRILKYSPGNLLVRAMVPLAGGAEINIKCDITDDGRVVATTGASAAIKSYIGAGALLTVGADKDIFTLAAQDVSHDLNKMIKEGKRHVDNNK